jgi:hypothetical protein
MDTPAPANGGVERARGEQFYSIQITNVMFIVAAFTRRPAAQAEGREHRDARKLICSPITRHSNSAFSCPPVPHGKHMGAFDVASNFLPRTQLHSRGA